MTLARELAKRIVATREEDLPPQAIRYAKIGILDTLGVALAGSGEAAASIGRRIAGSDAGPCVVFGTAHRASALSAAFVNGIAANVLDFDDCTDHLGGHPSSPVLPALIALGETLDARPRDVLLAYVVGFETETQIGRGVNFHHYEKGWHPTSTLGVFGAAASCAKLAGLSEEQTATALALATSLSSGIKANLGSMTKPLHVGHCARNGLLAALLAQDGFSANEDAFEHHQGFLEVFNGAGNYDAQRILAKWGAPFDIAMPGVVVKQYPCCLSAQSAIDATLALVRDHNVQPEQVARIETFTYARRLEHTNRPTPRSALDAKLSLQYCIARAVLHGEVVLGHFEADAHRDPPVQRFMKLVHANAFPHASPGENDDFAAEIRITMLDGRTLIGNINRPVGHEPGIPLPEPLLHKKFDHCAGRLLTAQQMAAVKGAVAEFESLPGIRNLTAMLATDGAPRRAVAAG